MAKHKRKLYDWERYDRSQKSHLRLNEFYRSRKKNPKCDFLATYHYDIFLRQLHTGEVLSKKRRQEVYNAWLKWERGDRSPKVREIMSSHR